MKLALTLPPGPSLGLRRLANENGISLEEAATRALEDWLIGHGYQETVHELDEDTVTAGEA